MNKDVRKERSGWFQQTSKTNDDRRQSGMSLILEHHRLLAIHFIMNAELPNYCCFFCQKSLECCFSKVFQRISISSSNSEVPPGGRLGAKRRLQRPVVRPSRQMTDGNECPEG